ncbi:hypothetical protein [Rhodohalobacter mucosus]|nr:hypothetical protein [Rhodohalobacter mucosus]
MKSSYPIRYLAVVLGITFVVGCSSQVETNSIQRNLEFVESIGHSSSEAYITRSRSVSSDLQRYFYIADQGLAIVHQYTLDGDFVKSIGRRGRGPGEFSGNMNVYAKGDSLLVTDFTNLTVSLFHSDGELINTFNLEERHSTEFQFFNGLLVTGHSYSLPFGTDYEDEELLHLYDSDGNVKHGFGEFLEFKEPVPSIIQKNFTAVLNGELHVVFMFFPEYKIYTKNGDLKKSFRLDEVIPNLNYETNDKESIGDFIDSRVNDLTGRVGGLFISGERIFVSLANDSLLQIEELKLREAKLVHVRSYNYPLIDGDRNVIGYIDFFYSEKDNMFYILENEQYEGFVVSKYGVINDPN